MKTWTRLAAFGAVLAAVFGAAFLVGRAVGPTPDAEVGATHGDDHAEPAAGGQALDAPGGLSMADRGYRLDAETTTFAAGAPRELRFRVIGPDGFPVQGFDAAHEKELHLIVVSRDLTGYQHLHPSRRADGTWAQPLTLPIAGPYRAIADFVPAGGPDLALGVDLVATGDHHPSPLPAPEDNLDVDGYRVSLGGAPAEPGHAEVVLAVTTNDGSPVIPDRYLGAAGHLVALRSGDLAYLHVHPEFRNTPRSESGSGRRPDLRASGTSPESENDGGGDVHFAVEVPAAGTYRLFFEFSHDGQVRTAPFTVVVNEPAAGEAP